MLRAANTAVDGFETVSLQEQFVDIDEDWASAEIWGTIKAFSSPFTAGYFSIIGGSAADACRDRKAA